MQGLVGSAWFSRQCWLHRDRHMISKCDPTEPHRCCSHQLDAVDAAWVQKTAICERLGAKDRDELREWQADGLPLAILRVKAPAGHSTNTSVKTTQTGVQNVHNLHQLEGHCWLPPIAGQQQLLPAVCNAIPVALRPDNALEAQPIALHLQHSPQMFGKIDLRYSL